MKQKLPLHAAHLRLLALGLMLLDHLWAAIVPGNDWMTMLGRLAFPIFAFQIAEGYYHTSNYKRYVRRLLIFALVSEIPFNLLLASSVMYPFHQNVMFTLLLGLVGVRAMDRAKQENTSSRWLKSLCVVLLVSLGGAIAFTDYGACGVLTVVAFGVLRDVPYAKAAQAVAMILLHGVFMEGRVFLLGSMEIPNGVLK